MTFARYSARATAVFSAPSWNLGASEQHLSAAGHRRPQQGLHKLGLQGRRKPRLAGPHMRLRSCRRWGLQTGPGSLQAAGEGPRMPRLLPWEPRKLRPGQAAGSQQGLGAPLLGPSPGGPAAGLPAPCCGRQPGRQLPARWVLPSSGCGGGPGPAADSQAAAPGCRHNH